MPVSTAFYEPGTDAVESKQVPGADQQVEAEGEATGQAAFALPGVHESLFGELLAELTLLAVGIPGRPHVMSLAGVLLEAHDGVVAASTTDFEVTLRTVLPGRYDGPDTVVQVRHSDLLKQLTALGSGVKKAAERAVLPVRLDLNTLTVEACGYTMPLDRMEVNERVLAHVRRDVPPTLAEVDIEEFATLTTRVGAALGTDATLPWMGGLHTVVTDGRITFEATNRFHLTVGSMAATTHAGCDEVVPGRLLLAGLKGLRKLGVTGAVTLGSDHEMFVVTAERRTLSIRMLYGATFPKTKHLLPEETSGSLELDRAQAVAAVTTAKALIAAKNIGISHVRLVVDDQQQVRWVPEIDDPHRQKTVKTPPIAATVHGDPHSMVQFSADYVLAALNNFTGETVTLHPQNDVDPTVFADTPNGVADPLAFKHLVMPVRIQGAAPAEQADCGPADAAPAEP